MAETQAAAATWFPLPMLFASTPRKAFGHGCPAAAQPRARDPYRATYSPPPIGRRLPSGRFLCNGVSCRRGFAARRPRLKSAPARLRAAHARC